MKSEHCKSPTFLVECPVGMVTIPPIDGDFFGGMVKMALFEPHERLNSPRRLGKRHENAADAEVSLWFFPLFRRDLGIRGKSLDVYGLKGLECQGGAEKPSVADTLN